MRVVWKAYPHPALGIALGKVNVANCKTPLDENLAVFFVDTYEKV